MPFLTIPNYQLSQIQQLPPLAELQISALITNSRMKTTLLIIINCMLKPMLPSEEYELMPERRIWPDFAKESLFSI